MHPLGYNLPQFPQGPRTVAILLSTGKDICRRSQCTPHQPGTRPELSDHSSVPNGPAVKLGCCHRIVMAIVVPILIYIFTSYSVWQRFVKVWICISGRKRFGSFFSCRISWFKLTLKKCITCHGWGDESKLSSKTGELGGIIKDILNRVFRQPTCSTIFTAIFSHYGDRSTHTHKKQYLVVETWSINYSFSTEDGFQHLCSFTIRLCTLISNHLVIYGRLSESSLSHQLLPTIPIYS